MARGGVSLRTESNLVLVPVTVTDRNGATVADLAPSNFQILDNGELRPIFSFERDDAPMSAVLVVDTSGSMRSKIARTRIALRNLAAATNLDDEVALITFASQPHLRRGFTQDID